MRVRAAAGIVALLLLAPGCGEDDRAPGAGNGALVGVDWLLAEVTHDGETQDVPAAQGVVLRFDGEGGYRLLACNHYRGRVTTDGPSIRFTRESATDESCGGRTGVIERQITTLTTGRVSWALDGATLHLTGPRVAADFVRQDLGEGLPAPRRILLRHDGGEHRWDHRVGVSGRGYATYLSVQVRPDDTGPFRTTTTLVDRTRLDVTSAPVGDGVLVAGTVADPGVRVEYHGTPTGRVPLRTWPLANGARVFAGVVEPGGEVVILDRRGHRVTWSRPVIER